jgi:hypothetical protein
MKSNILFSWICAVVTMLLLTDAVFATIVFDSGFEDGLKPTELSGGTLIGTQGYSNYGFGSQFLWSGGGTITLSLTNLPEHTSIDVKFLLAVIDSWDGIGAYGLPGHDYLWITVDGQYKIADCFSNWGDGLQTFTEFNTRLFSGTNVFVWPNTGWSDSAYNMGLSNRFTNIPHTASTLQVSWWSGGDGWQGGLDESFAIDNVQVVLNGVIPEPATLLLLGLGGVILQRRKK